MDEHQLIASIRKGNTHSFGILMDRYTKMCYSIAYRISGDNDEVEDIVQESFIAAYENLKSFKSESKFSTWLYRITLNKALLYKKKQQYFEPAEEINHIDEEDTEEDIHAANEATLKKALSTLGDKERLLIDLYYYQEQSIRDIATICGISEVNAKVMLHRARKKIETAIHQAQPST